MQTLTSRQVYANSWMTVREDAIRLADGTILLQGILRHADEQQTLPITGGTGAYEGARGSVTIRSDDKQERNLWEIHLLAG